MTRRADEPVPALPYDRETLVTVLVYHWQTNTSGCGCGWGSRPAELGRSWPEHIADVYEASVAGRVTP